MQHVIVLTTRAEIIQIVMMFNCQRQIFMYAAYVRYAWVRKLK